MFNPIGHIRGIVQQQARSSTTARRKAPSAGKTQEPVYTTTKIATSPLAALAKSITARIGFKDRFEKQLAPMLNAKTVGDMKQYFQSLPRVVTIARERPKAASKILNRAAQSPKALYVSLTAIACGDRSAVPTAAHALAYLKGNYSLALDGIRRVAAYDPQSAHTLLTHLLDNKSLTPKTRLSLFKEIMMSKGFGKESLPTSFEKLMKGTSPKDRNRIIYPSMLGLLEKWQPHDARLRVNQEITKEMLRGWIASCQIISDPNHAHAQKVLDISRSARG